MKLRYIFATLAAALTLATGCEKEVAEHVLAEVQVSSSYLAFPAQGGSVEVNVKAVDSWTVKDLPEWITSSPSSGSQGESTVKFTATAAEETREASFGIECAGKTQTINAIQVTEAKEVVTLSVAQALEIIKPLGEGQVAPGTYRVRGVVCKIQEISTSYGNATYYLSDDGSFKGSNKNDCNWLQVYRGLWINGAAISRADQFAVGDEIIIEGALMDYKGTPETKEKTAVVVEHNPSLIKVAGTTLLDSASGEGVTEFPKEGGSIMVSLSIKGEGFHVIIPEEAKNWLHIEDFGSDYVTLSADANTAGERSVEVGFSTRSEGVTYNCSQVFTQKGEVAEVSVADFLAAPVGDAQFRITGVVSGAYDSDSQGKSFYLRDWSGETLVYRLDDYSTCGATVGDIITVVGKRGAYKENPQMVSGVYEKHIATVKDKTLAEIAAAADDANVYYIATGNVKEIANETYGNLYLTDDSGDLYVYGCYPGWGASGDNRKNFLATAGIKVGDKLSVIGVKGTHNGSPQIANGIYFSHEAGEAPSGFDFTPSAEYLSADNLWKSKAVGNEMYYYYHCVGADWNGTDTIASDVPFMSFKESTYELSYDDATTQAWQNQFFIFPAEGHFIALDAAKTYKIRLTLGANLVTPAFFKLEKYSADHPKHEGELIWEYGSTKLDPSTPLVLEHEFTGVSADNVTLVFDFGGNPAGAKAYIKDITLLEVGGGSDTPSNIAGIIKAIPAEATGNNTAVEFDANLSSPAVVSYVNGNNAYIQDETGAILLYMSDHGFNAGDTIQGKLSVKAYWYNGIPEMVAIGSEYSKGSGEAPAPEEITIADLLANYDAKLLRLVKLSGVTVTGGIADGDRNGEVSQGSDKIAVYAQLNNKGLVLGEGETGDLITIPGYYKTNKQVYFWDNAWFSKGGAAVSISIDGDLSEWAGVTTGIESAEGPYLTLKATYDADYLYLYSKRTWHEGLWKDSYGGYFYYEIDTDNNPATGTNDVNGNTGYGVETWFFLYLFTGSADAPTFAANPSGSAFPSSDVIANVVAAGSTDKSVIETEVRIPRADAGITGSGPVRIYSWGNKSASNLKSADSYLLLDIK